MGKGPKEPKAKQGSLNFDVVPPYGTPGYTIRDEAAKTFATDFFGMTTPALGEPSSYRAGLVEQIIRDEHTLRNGWYVEECPGEAFYEARIAAYHEEILRLDAEGK